VPGKLDRLGVTRCGNYAFRHMNATVMDGMQVPLKTRQAWLGHADIKTMMLHYTWWMRRTGDSRILSALCWRVLERQSCNES